MNNKELIENFVLGSTTSKGSNLFIQGNKLFNYNKTLAKRIGKDQIQLNVDHSSPTTSLNQKIIKEFGKENGIKLIEVSARKKSKNY